ncbi:MULTISPECIES: glycosyl hydrolase [Acidobacteriaceae]|uniref:glycosyl hydrolase n=1 Tax=Acidobacteriaceae TaxID=204434 RepID=UPI00131DC81D|nr:MULTISPECIES: glycosyl hydrolase [Acidobacteriaceae]MDW5267072.1 glycosyl hydrolase [Edaphobacter sp.]
MKLVALVAFCVVAGAPLSAQTVATVAQQFQNPAKNYRPMVRWWWPGNDVKDAELRREVDLLDQANFGGAEIQPFTIGLDPNMPEATRKRVDDYLSPSFFAHMQAALEEARAKGMWMDYTFGSGWPFGGAGVVTPELASTELRSEHQTIRGPVHFRGKILMPLLRESIAKDANLPSGWLNEFKQREKLVAVVAIRGDNVQYVPNQDSDRAPAVKSTGQLDPGTSIVLTGHMLPDGTLDWDVPPGTWQVFAFKEMPTGQKVVGGAGEGPQLVLDHMNKHAFDAYAERVGGTARQYDGQYFGHGLRAIFCDSLEVQAYLFWNDHFLQEFRQRRGYDLTPYLPILKIPGFEVPYNGTAARLPLYDIEGIGDRVRRDYWQTVSDVMIENFYSPFIQWAAANNLQSRVQAHGSPTDLLRVYGASSIPETEDLLDNGRYDFLKMSSSGADLYGRKIVSSESFVWHGKAYQTTPEKIKRYADELLTAGINEIIYHGYPYEYMDRPFPGWHPFATEGAFSSDMNQSNPFWPYLPQLNQYITRLQYISQAGTTEVPVALYRSMLAYDPIEPAPPEPEIDTRLMDAGYNFDHIDAYTILKSKVVEGKLISPGGEKFSVLVLPQPESISVPLADQLVTFARQGLPIVFMGGVPKTESSIVGGQLSESPGPDTLRNVLKDGHVHVAPDAKSVAKILEASISPNLHFNGAPLPFIEKRIGNLDTFFLRNPDDVAKQTIIESHALGSPELWNPWTGTIRPLAHVERHGGIIRVPIDVDPYGSVLLVFDPDGKSGEKPIEMSAPAQPELQIAVGENGWDFHGVGIGPGSHPQVIDMKMSSLEDWTMIDRLKNFSGRGQYTTTFTVPASLLSSNRRIVLDLGDVGNVAQISINGEPGPNLLLRPYRADVTPLLHAGENTLEITVVNALFNALSAKGVSANYLPEETNTANGLLPSGLVGPVRLEEMKSDGSL